MNTILHVITGGLGRGGAEGVLLRLVRESRTELRHVVFTLRPMPAYVDDFRALGVELRSLDVQHFGAFARGFGELLREVRRVNPAVIQTWMYHSDLLFGLIGKLLGIPVVWNIRQSDCSRKNLGPRTWLTAKADAWLSRFVPETIINCSSSSIGLHRQFGYAGKFVHIPNGFGAALPADPGGERAALRRELSLGGGDFVFGLVARFHPVKNHPALVEAFSRVHERLPGARLVMAGVGVARDNPEFDAICRGADAGALRPLGFRSDVERLYRMFDVFVLCSAWGEGFSNVVAEAMLQGTPCIVTDVGDAAEIVADTGWVVPAGDVDALAAAMLAAAQSSPVELARRGEAARQRVLAHYSIDTMVRDYRRVWDSAIASRS
jgi:glycosyltransferase involved in cell wall biosynthesis